MNEVDMPEDDTRIAIVGMTGRFPGAGTVEQLWSNLTGGPTAIREITEEELAAARVPPAMLANPQYVRRGAPLDDPGLFDASFFGFSAREAEATDPQHRLFLECCWEALESAGYQPNRVPGRVGVFGGVGHSFYGLRHVLASPEVMDTITRGQYAMGTAPDSLCMVVSYRLGLDGPVFSVQSSCSTSLVAVHVAVQSLLTQECDTALAGASRIEEPVPEGYLFEEGSLTSPDGIVRSLDADANGTVLGNGVGVVVLKRLTDALADGDHVHAVILGSAVNNDGSARAGLVAPSVEGQSTVISDAMSVAGVDPGEIDYVECHAPGTRLGDSVELAALDRAFPTARDTPCVLSSTKPDLGHLDRASGMAGLIKAATAVERAQLPATRGFRQPNTALPRDRFRVLTTYQPWTTPGDTPRRAGVSSFGAGGTNAHVVLEQAPPRPAADPLPGPHVLVLSARTATALTAARLALRDRLADGTLTDTDLGDVAYTLQLSRAGFGHRLVCVADDLADAVAALDDPTRHRTAHPSSRGAPATRPDTLTTAADQWLDGADVDWAALHRRTVRRVPLPTYPFERREYFIPRPALGAAAAREDAGLPGHRLPDPADWINHPSWRRVPLPSVRDPGHARALGPWLVVADDEVGAAAAALLRADGAEVALVDPATVATPTDAAAFLREHGRPRAVLHTASLAAPRPEDPAARFAAAQDRGFHSVRALAKALSEHPAPGDVDLLVCTGGAVNATTHDLTAPEQATLLGLLRVIAQEVGDLDCRLIDVDVTGCAAALGGTRELAAAVLTELGVDLVEPVALRGTDRWVRHFDRLPLPAPPARGRRIPEGGTVLITGGLGAVGQILAEHLVTTRHTRLVLTATTPLPPEDQWDEHLAHHDPASDRTAQHITTLRRLTGLGADVLALAADAGDPVAMAAALDVARQRFGPLDAVIHAAGTMRSDRYGPVVDLDRAACEEHFHSKVTGQRVLHDLLHEGEAPVRLAVSSMSTLLGGLGHGPYAAANSALDAQSVALTDTTPARWQTVDWDTWLTDGVDPRTLAPAIRDYTHDRAEGTDLFERALSLFDRAPHLVVSCGPLDERITNLTDSRGADKAPTLRHPRPELDIPYEEPTPGDETHLAAIWCEVLGLDRVGANDDFFDLGGHSLAGVRVMTRVRARFGGTKADVLIANPTVRRLATALAATATAGTGDQP
ncbi:SDR family NAD(P)-dependent oxidoreductase [Actinoalloteichus caeruleus]|uniref:SDR family NAD(P)-dependent oxidoreductase n=1 Tax=Actinoalloteichus cyanogriseus TaxID=2893586 RepID=UPI003BB8B5E7